MNTDWLTARLRETGVSREQLGAALGRTRDKVGRLIRGDQEWTLGDARLFARALNLSLGDFLVGSGLAEIDELALSSADRPRLRFRVGAFESGVEALVQPGDTYSADPTDMTSFLAEVADDSADRFYPSGTILTCAPLGAPPYKLRVGSRFLFVHYRTSVKAGDAFEVRVGVLSQAPDPGGLIIFGPTRSTANSFSIWLDRRMEPQRLAEPQPGFKVLETAATTILHYQPDPDDPILIIAKITSAARPEP